MTTDDYKRDRALVRALTEAGHQDVADLLARKMTGDPGEPGEPALTPEQEHGQLLMGLLGRYDAAKMAQFTASDADDAPEDLGGLLFGGR
jgi:hypothetical protein